MSPTYGKYSVLWLCWLLLFPVIPAAPPGPNHSSLRLLISHSFRINGKAMSNPNKQQLSVAPSPGLLKHAFLLFLLCWQNPHRSFMAAAVKSTLSVALATDLHRWGWRCHTITYHWNMKINVILQVYLCVFIWRLNTLIHGCKAGICENRIVHLNNPRDSGLTLSSGVPASCQHLSLPGFPMFPSMPRGLTGPLPWDTRCKAIRAPHLPR